MTRLNPPGRPGIDVLGLPLTEHQTPTHHVAQLAIGLNPVPDLAHPGRERPAAQRGIFRNQLAQEIHLRLADFASPKTQ